MPARPKKTARRSTGSKIRKSRGSVSLQSHAATAKALKANVGAVPKAGGLKKTAVPHKRGPTKLTTRFVSWFRAFGTGLLRKKTIG
jgi:hypothetical protein|tara:strand:- start:610 stop:867 length:258 start_codon:yes stop_codon:yes gene_type:complete|mmetsp:Transcript_12564/g.46954  ORF Transcript_12564/g.46954 Transcript_12564/m.46954 type:complete len:86 (-) Transcript_12564:7-264(-)